MDHLTAVSDETLLKTAIQGSEAAWAELVGRYNTKGMNYLYSQVTDPYQAQDIMQNLWAALVGAVRREMPDSFAALFWTLLRRRLIDELRRKGRNREAATLDSPAEEGTSLLERQPGNAPDPLDETVRSQEANLLQRALAQLPDHYRLVVVARQLEGRSNKETAAQLVAAGLVTDDGNVEKRVENYYYRGLKELRRQLLDLGYSGGGGAV